jgi:hypothetical protein
VSTVVVLALIIGAVVFVRWRNGLHLFSEAGAVIGAPHLKVGQTLYVGDMADPAGRDDLRIRIDSIRPVVTTNTAHAKIAVLMCTLPYGLNSTLGSAYSLHGSCASVRPFVPATYTISSGIDARTTIVVVAVTPHAPGHVYISGINLTYERGSRHGEQHTGVDIDTRTRRP